MQLNWLDFTLTGLMLASLLLGAWRGLVFEVISVMGWVAAFVLAPIYAATAASTLPAGVSPESLRYAAGFVMVFIATAFCGGLLAWVAQKLISSVGLRPVDRLLGAAFGGVRGLVLLLALTIAVGLSPLKSSAAWQDSVAAGGLRAVLQAIAPLFPPALGQYL